MSFKVGFVMNLALISLCFHPPKLISPERRTCRVVVPQTADAPAVQCRPPAVQMARVPPGPTRNGKRAVREPSSRVVPGPWRASSVRHHNEGRQRALLLESARVCLSGRVCTYPHTFVCADTGPHTRGHRHQGGVSHRSNTPATARTRPRPLVQWRPFVEPPRAPWPPQHARHTRAIHRV